MEKRKKIGWKKSLDRKPAPIEVIISLVTWLNQKWLFWRAGFYPANQSNLKSFQKGLIGWKKDGPPKKPLLFWSCKQVIRM